MKTPRIAPLADDAALDDDTRDLLARSTAGPAVNIFRTLARHPKLFKRWMVFGNHVLFKSTLPPRDRELLILRTGWLCKAEYEWGQHVAIARAIGITDAEITRIAAGPDNTEWDAFDAALLRAAGELHENSVVSDETWNELSARYSTEQMMDTVFTVGQYTLVSMALNSFGVGLDSGVEGFPS